MEIVMNRLMRRGLLTAFLLAISMHVIVGAQGGGQNINVITGSGNQFTGDLYRQRQNESVIGISSINPANILIAYNDYRVVDVADDIGVGSVTPNQGFLARVLDFLRAPWTVGRDPQPKQLKTAAHAWIGLSFSNNGGKSWFTGLLPGRYSPVPANTHPLLGDTHRLAEFDAASDPVMATTPDKFFLAGIAFNPSGPGSDGKSIGFVARFTDRNNAEQGQTLQYDGLKILPGLETAGDLTFVDKPQVAAGANGQVYAAFVVFDQADPSRLSSKILFYRSGDYGQTWAGPVVVSDPLTRNQAPWIVVDPRNEDIVYIGWRVFTAPKGKLSNAIVGRKSFDGGATFLPSTPYTVMESLRAFDQPQGQLVTGTPPVPRSNAYPTATIDGNGALHVAIQEYVYPHTANQNQRGRPLNQNSPVTQGVPRIVVSSSYNGGVSWTQRKAADLGTATVPAGTQFMPVLTAAGEPGPSCFPGSSGPRSRVMVMYYDARASGWGAAPGTQGYVIGGGSQFDVRIAQASACSTGGLSFSPSQQLSQYTRNAEAPFAIESMSGAKHPQSSVDPRNYQKVNRLYTAFCAGNCGFTGDYIGLSPRVPYVRTAIGDWKPTTAVTDALDRDKLPAPVVQGVWADMRDALLPSEGELRLNVPAGSTGIDVLPWNFYQPPGTGLAPCLNPGSRDQNVYTAEYTPGGLFASAPATFRSSALARSYPLFIENRTPEARFYRVTIDSLANASFDYSDFDSGHTSFGEPLSRVTTIKIGPISSVTGSVVVGPNVNTSVAITVEETTAPVINEDFETVTDGEVIPPPQGARTTVYLVTDGLDETTTETYTPSLDPTPHVSKPFGTFQDSTVLPLHVDPAPALIPSPTPFSPNPNLTGSTFMETPFSPNPFSPNPFSPNPFSPNPFSPNPFSPNPFSPNPFSPNAFPDGATVHDVTDVSYVIRNEGDQTAAFRAFVSLTTSAAPNRVYQALINRAVPTPITVRDADGNCVTADSWSAVPVSTIQNPFSPNPFSPNPFSPNPFSPNPFSPNPFSPNPFSPNYPPEFSNSTFYVKPADSGPSAGYAAPPTEDVIVFTIREFLLVEPDPNNPNDPNQPLDPADLDVTLEAQVPEQPIEGGGFEETPPVAGTQVPHHLAFTQQPANGFSNVPLSPVSVTVYDAFGAPLSGNNSPQIPVTLALGNNPNGATLSGTLTVTSVAGVATFNDLTVDTIQNGYTLVASSSGVQGATSTPFNVSANLANQFAVRNTDFLSFGYGGLRGTEGTGTLAVSGVSGTVTAAILYWNGPTTVVDPTVNNQVTFAGEPITGVNLGIASDNNWPRYINTQTYAAD